MTIGEDWRYFAPSGALSVGGPSTWHVLDWDQRRIIGVTMDEEQDSDDLAIRYLNKHIDSLGPDVYAIHVSQDGELLSVSTDPEDDEALWAHYPTLEEFQLPDHINVKTVLRSDLLELDRLTPNVDLVSYTSGATAKEVVFKYYFLFQFLFKIWHELNLWIRLSPHPHIAPFDRVVLDELGGRVVGFTSVYIPGGTVEETISRTFKLAWLQQLTSVIDDLNLKHGIAHQDVAPRNLLIDPATDALLLFDFNYSGRIGTKAHADSRNDIKGVVFTMYEIITRDMHFREVSHENQDMGDVQGLEEWVQHPEVQLDRPVEEYRTVLNEWVERRQRGKQVKIYTEAPEYIDFPVFPEPPGVDKVRSDINGNPVVVKYTLMLGARRDLIRMGKPVLNWERPAQKTLGDRDRVFADGRLIRG